MPFDVGVTRAPGGHRYHLPEQRRAEILRVIAQCGHVRTVELATHLAVSYATVTRDLHRLDRLGVLGRIRGGARAIPMLGPARPRQAATVADTPRTASSVQEMMTEHAASLVGSGDTIALAADDLTVQLARLLIVVPGLTVVTNSMPVSEIFTRFGRTDQTAVLTGGVRTRSGALAGPLAEAMVRRCAIHRCFIAPHGADQRKGFTAADLGEAAINRALIANADTTIVLADHTRWNAVGIAGFGPLSTADILISDDDLPASAVHALQQEISSIVLVGAR